MHKLNEETMKKLTLIFLVFSNTLLAQNDNSFLVDFLIGEELAIENKIEEYIAHDFSDIWTNTNNEIVYGIIGDEHQRVRIKFLSVLKSHKNSSEYLVKGKVKVKETVSDFNGVIRITEIRETKELNYGIDNQYENKGIRSQGILIGDYIFTENKDQTAIGVFTGKLYSKWYLDSKNEINYDDIQIYSDQYSNNSFIGIWKDYNSEREKICNWGDYRVPLTNTDFDIGTGEFNVSQKYWNRGWFEFALNNNISSPIINDERPTINEEESNLESKEWWE